MRMRRTIEWCVKRLVIFERAELLLVEVEDLIPIFHIHTYSLALLEPAYRPKHHVRHP